MIYYRLLIATALSIHFANTSDDACYSNCNVPQVIPVVDSPFGSSCDSSNFLTNSSTTALDPCNNATSLSVVTIDNCSTINLEWIRPYYVHGSLTEQREGRHIIVDSNSATLRCGEAMRYCILFRYRPHLTTDVKDNSYDRCLEIENIHGFGSFISFVMLI